MLRLHRAGSLGVVVGRVVDLDNINPSEEEVRAWAYDETVVFWSEDEDLILAESRYVPVLCELIEVADCPKADWISHILQLWAREAALSIVGRDRRGDGVVLRKALVWLSERLVGSTAASVEARSYVERLVRWTSGAARESHEIASLLGDLSRDRDDGLDKDRWVLDEQGTIVHALLPYGARSLDIWQHFVVDRADGSVTWWLQFPENIAKA